MHPLKCLPRPLECIFPRLYSAKNKPSLQYIKTLSPFSQVHPQVVGCDNEREPLLAVYKLYESIQKNLLDVNSFKIRMGNFMEPFLENKIESNKKYTFQLI